MRGSSVASDDHILNMKNIIIFVSTDEALCSHVWSICYQAESLFRPRSAAPCGRRCAVRVPPSRSSALPVPLGQPAPMT